MSFQSLFESYLSQSDLFTEPFRSDNNYVIAGLQQFNDPALYLGPQHGWRAAINVIGEVRYDKMKLALELTPEVSEYHPTSPNVRLRPQMIDCLLKSPNPNATYIRCINFNALLIDCDQNDQIKFNQSMQAVEYEITHMMQFGSPSRKWKHQNNKIRDWSSLFDLLPPREPQPVKKEPTQPADSTQPIITSESQVLNTIFQKYNLS